MAALARSTCSSLWRAVPSCRVFSVLPRCQEKLYTKSHEWIDVNKSAGTVGITNYAQGALGEIVFVQLPSKGTKYAKGDSFGSVESVKAASDLYAPWAGEVTAVNTKLEQEPALVNSSPEDQGWMIKLTLKGTPTGLMTAKEYASFLEKEKH